MRQKRVFLGTHTCSVVYMTSFPSIPQYSLLQPTQYKQSLCFLKLGFGYTEIYWILQLALKYPLDENSPGIITDTINVYNLFIAETNYFDTTLERKYYGNLNSNLQIENVPVKVIKLLEHKIRKQIISTGILKPILFYH